METKGVGLMLGILGFIMASSSLIKAGITGAVIGTNSTSKLLGFFGIGLMIIAIIIEKYELKKHHKMVLKHK